MKDDQGLVRQARVREAEHEAARPQAAFEVVPPGHGVYCLVLHHLKRNNSATMYTQSRGNPVQSHFGCTLVWEVQS